MRYLLKFSYDGTLYKGFQRQKGLNTVQEQLEKALTKINNNIKTVITATGRTDKKVHALCQYAHVDIEISINEKKLKKALNTYLPNDIHIIEVKEINKDFHARYNVLEKEYQYKINIGEYNPLDRNYIFQYNHELNINKMKEAIKYFVGKHDFRAFATNNRDKENCIRTIFSANIKKDKNIITIIFKGSGFLKYQVRNMVGILIKVGEEKIKPDEILNILKSKDRSKSGKTAPPEGLYLVNIKY